MSPEKGRDCQKTISRTRVLRVIARMNVGGPAWQVSVLTRGLDPDRYVTRLVCGEVDDVEADYVELRDPSLSVHRVPSLGRSIRFTDDLRSLLVLWREIRRFKPDIIHTHTAKAGVLGRLVAVAARVPVRVHTFHGHLLHGYFSPLGSRFVRLLESLLARWTTALIAVGDQTQEALIAAGIGRREQYSSVYPGVDIGPVPGRRESREKLGLPADSPVLLFVGRLTGVKRPDRLIDTMGIVLERCPDAVLVVAGGGELFDETRAKAEPLGDSVRFLGWFAEVSVLYAAADVAIISSDNEGMPVTLIEAALAGVPGVATDVGSVSEVVLDGETGFVVESTPEALARAVARLFGDDGLRERMGNDACLRARRRFGVDQLIREHEELYQESLNR